MDAQSDGMPLPEKIIIEKKDSSLSDFIDSLTGLIMLVVFLSVFLWNWDGFWQTDITILNKLQKKTFYNKYIEENSKLTAVENNKKIAVILNEEIGKLRAEISTLKKTIDDADNIGENLKMSIWIIKSLKERITDGQLKEVLNNCYDERCVSLLQNEKPK